MDISTFVFLSLMATIVIVASWVTYTVAIREAKRTIEDAFDDHISRLHSQHTLEEDEGS